MVNCSVCNIEFNSSVKYLGQRPICEKCRAPTASAVLRTNKSFSTADLRASNNYSEFIKSRAEASSKNELIPKPAYNTRYGRVLQERKEFNKNKEELKEYVWNKAQEAPGYDPDKYREDKCGNLIYKASYGKNTKMGWEVDHSKPVSLGGTNHKNNLQALQASQNKSKSNQVNYDYKNADPKGVSRYDLIKTDVDKRSSLVKSGSVLFNYDGTIDKRSEAVKSGTVQLKKDGSISENSAAIKSGLIRLKSNNTVQTVPAKASVLHSSVVPLSHTKVSSQMKYQSLPSTNNRTNTPNSYTQSSINVLGSNDINANNFKTNDRQRNNSTGAYARLFTNNSLSYSNSPHSNTIQHRYTDKSRERSENLKNNASNTNDNYHRCKDGSRDMRYSENWGHDKYDDADSPPVNNADSDDDYHRCNDGSRDMRYSENWGHDKYDNESD